MRRVFEGLLRVKVRVERELPVDYAYEIRTVMPQCNVAKGEERNVNIAC